MNTAELEKFRALLTRQRDELVAEGDLEIERHGDGEVVAKVDEDAAPLTEMNQVIASNRNRARTVRLREIATALERLEEDPEAFGHCEDCDEAIPRQRMELMPWVRLCIQCQQDREQDDTPRSRRNLTDYR